uniref:Uncharacterized protein n=1 Tax=Zea mays TaxID=4577 RepID=A0A804QHR6_MAIZE
MPPAVFLGCTSFSTSTRFRDGSSLFAIAAVLLLPFFLRSGPLSSVLEPAKHELLLIDVSLKAHGPFIQRPNPAGGLSLGVGSDTAAPPLQ